MDTYSVKKFVIGFDAQRNVSVTRLVTVQGGLNWQEAKELRRQNKSLTIVRENAAVRQAREQEQADA